MIAMSLALAYSRTAKGLHWLVLALLVVEFGVAWTMPHIGRNTPLGTLIRLHFSFGVLILGVVLIRLAWLLAHGWPRPIAMPAWQHRAALAVHWLLYLLLLALPVLGWLDASWHGYPVSLFGLFEVPKLLATRQPGWQWTGDIHQFLATYVLLTLVGLHVLGALYHHFVLRDGVLKRMLPTL
jgi:cytochrome b561